MSSVCMVYTDRRVGHPVPHHILHSVVYEETPAVTPPIWETMLLGLMALVSRSAENKVTCSSLIGRDQAERCVYCRRLVLRSIFSSASRFLAASAGPASRPRHSTGAQAEWEGAGRRWQRVSGGLSCDPDSCTSLCPGGERRFSSFIWAEAQLLPVINTVTERQGDKRGPMEDERVTLISFHALKMVSVKKQQMCSDWFCEGRPLCRRRGAVQFNSSAWDVVSLSSLLTSLHDLLDPTPAACGALVET